MPFASKIIFASVTNKTLIAAIAYISVHKHYTIINCLFKQNQLKYKVGSDTMKRLLISLSLLFLLVGCSDMTAKHNKTISSSSDSSYEHERKSIGPCRTVLG